MGVGGTAVNQVSIIGGGSGTGVVGGGLFPLPEDDASGNITVTNNSGVITIVGKGLKFHTAMSLTSNLCISLNLTK
jgi:hypothetical protein